MAKWGGRSRRRQKRTPNPHAKTREEGGAGGDIIGLGHWRCQRRQKHPVDQSFPQPPRRPPRAVLSIPPLNLSASILVLLIFYLTWKIRAHALSLASYDVRAHSTGATAALAQRSQGNRRSHRPFTRTQRVQQQHWPWRQRGDWRSCWTYARTRWARWRRWPWRQRGGWRSRRTYARTRRERRRHPPRRW